MRIAIIAVPYDDGERSVGVGLGPARLIEGGLVSELRAGAHDVREEIVELAERSAAAAGCLDTRRRAASRACEGGHARAGRRGVSDCAGRQLQLRRRHAGRAASGRRGAVVRRARRLQHAGDDDHGEDRRHGPRHGGGKGLRRAHRGRARFHPGRRRPRRARRDARPRSSRARSARGVAHSVAVAWTTPLR